MRSDMPRVIVNRPRIVDRLPRKGRDEAREHLPTQIGMRRSVQERGGFKRLNENLAPLRRFLEKQVGRPWNKIYSEIATVLRVDSTVQQHVRDHISDFVAIYPRSEHRTFYTLEGKKIRLETHWHQILYVDPRDGILKRSEDHPDRRRRRREKRMQFGRSLPPRRSSWRRIASCGRSRESGTRCALGLFRSRNIGPS